MLLSIAVACGIFALLSLPGWILVARTTEKIWVYLAAGFCSQAAVILLTALLSLLVPGQLPVGYTALVALGLSLAAFACRPRGEGRVLPAFDPWAFVVPVCAMLAGGLITRGAISMADGDLLVRAWFNADGFKHLAHVQALAGLGLPARDLFGAGDTLAYYWLFHVIPGLGAAVQGDAARALIASGLVQTFAFWIVVYGLVRMAGANGAWAALFTLIGWLAPSLDGLVALILSRFDPVVAASEVNIEGVNAALLNGSTLFRASLYLPQHQLMLAGLLSWGTLAIVHPPPLARAVRLLALAPLIAAGAISTLLGVACLAVFALTSLLNRKDTLLRCLSRIAAVGVLAMCVPLVLGIVELGSDNGLNSPAFANRSLDYPAGLRFLLAIPGLLFVYWVGLLGLVGLQAAWRKRPLPGSQAPVFNFALALTAVGLGGLLLSTLVDHQRLILEFQLRVSLLGWLGLIIAAAWLLRGEEAGTQKLAGVSMAGAILLLALGLATPILDGVWHVALAARWVVRIPQDDLAVLDALARDAPPNAVVLQKPELPAVSGGQDVWVPILAGRTVHVSPRTTHWKDQKDRYEQAAAFFHGSEAMPAGHFDYIYLSRALDRDRYDVLLSRLEQAPDWRRKLCLANACLWERAP